MTRGNFWLAPLSDPDDRYPAGIDGNAFRTFRSALRAIPIMRECDGRMDVPWVVRYRDESLMESRGRYIVRGVAWPFEVTDGDIGMLMIEAGAAGDMEQFRLCKRSIDGDPEARIACVRAIAAARAMEDA